MCLKQEELIELYNQSKTNNPDKFIYDDVETLRYDSINKDDIDLNIKMIKTEEDYIINLFICKNSKLLFNCPIYKSNVDLSGSYDALLNDINEFNVDILIEKYYEKLKSFL